MTNPETNRSWYTILTYGGRGVAECGRSIPSGPWRSREDTLAAFHGWYERAGQHAGTVCAAPAVRLAGPYSTRRAARDADISSAIRVEVL